MEWYCWIVLVVCPSVIGSIDAIPVTATQIQLVKGVKCLSCGEYCSQMTGQNVPPCDLCQCEPTGDTYGPPARKSVCKIVRCLKTCSKTGYQLDNKGCQKCECINL